MAALVAGWLVVTLANQVGRWLPDYCGGWMLLWSECELQEIK